LSLAGRIADIGQIDASPISVSGLLLIVHTDYDRDRAFLVWRA
jgi:hypothetical protein